MNTPIIPTFTGTLENGQRIEHMQSGHLGTIEDHAAGSYYIRWDADLPARWFDARLIKPVTTVTDVDGCTLMAEVDESNPIPTVRVNAESPWDTFIAVDLTPEQAREFAAVLLRAADNA